MPSYTTTTAPITIPAAGQTVAVPVQDASWMTAGNFVWFTVPGANSGGTGNHANFTVQSVLGPTSVLLLFQSAPQDLVTGTVLPAGVPLSAGANPALTTSLGGGGTGATNPAAALANLGGIPSGADINSSGQVVSTHLTSPLPIVQGGTGQSNSFISSLTGISNGNHKITFGHGLGRTPGFVRVVIVCISNDNGYTSGTEIDAAGWFNTNDAVPQFAIGADSSNVYVNCAGLSDEPSGGNTVFQGASVPGPVTPTSWSDWNMKVYAA